MTRLRRRLIEEIALRGYSPRTEEAYVHAVACVAAHYGRSPDRLSDEQLRAYLLHLNRTHLCTIITGCTVVCHISGFFSNSNFVTTDESRN